MKWRPEWTTHDELESTKKLGGDLPKKIEDAIAAFKAGWKG